jgi:hypothetical protein
VVDGLVAKLSNLFCLLSLILPTYKILKVFIVIVFGKPCLLFARRTGAYLWPRYTN